MFIILTYINRLSIQTSLHVTTAGETSARFGVSRPSAARPNLMSQCKLELYEQSSALEANLEKQQELLRKLYTHVLLCKCVITFEREIFVCESILVKSFRVDTVLHLHDLLYFLFISICISYILIFYLLHSKKYI